MLEVNQIKASERHVSQGIYGWDQCEPLVEDSNTLLESMRAAFRTRLELHCKTMESTHLASTSSIWSGGNQVLASIVGQPCWFSRAYRDLAAQEGNSRALAEAYAERGEGCFAEISGTFSFLIVDRTAPSVIVGTDRVGRMPVYYLASEKGLVFGPSADTVLCHPLADGCQVESQSIYNYVYFHMVPSPASVYTGIRKLQAGQYLRYSEGSPQVMRYWRPSFSEQPVKSFQASGEELKSTLRDAVRKLVCTNKNTAAFLSGGLDSSSVVGMLSEVQEGESHAYSIGFSAQGYDEMEYARLTARHFEVTLHEYYVTPEDVVAALPMIATSYDEPFGNSSALPAWFCARAAADDGVECLLAGDGGDELFAGNSRYAKQSVFEMYLRLPEVIRAAFVERVLAVLPQNFPLASKGRRYVQLANMGLPARLQAYNFLNMHQPFEIFDREFLEGINTEVPMELLKETYTAPDEASPLNRMLYLDWQYTLTDNDLRKVSHMCAVAGVEAAYPMLDDQLIELSCRIPSRWKLQRGALRHFYKESVRGWLPDETIAKKKQGFGLPFGYWMRTHKPLQEIAFDNLLSLKARGYFNPAFIDQALELHRDSHAAYYGELVWILTVLELWLQRKDCR